MNETVITVIGIFQVVGMFALCVVWHRAQKRYDAELDAMFQ